MIPIKIQIILNQRGDSEVCVEKHIRQNNHKNSKKKSNLDGINPTKY